MSIAQVLLIAVGLSMDAFAVSVSAGLRMKEVSRGQMARIALHFGGFQALMPVMGWLAGRSLHEYIAACDHWVAFGILFVVGLKMIVTAARAQEGTSRGCGPLRHTELLLLSVATSIDALAVGVSIAMQQVKVWMPAIVTGIVTGLLSAIGVDLGDRIGTRVGRAAEALGGIVLCALGVRILVEHLCG